MQYYQAISLIMYKLQVLVFCIIDIAKLIGEMLVWTTEVWTIFFNGKKQLDIDLEEKA